jgi:hypothetical protein
MNNEINKGFYREANIVFLLLKHYEDGELAKNDLTEWKNKIEDLYKPFNEIDFNTDSTFDIEISYNKGVIKSASKRHFYIEAKGDHISKGKPVGIKSKIQSGLGQLIFAATQMDNGIKIGSNLCLAIPFHWEKTLRAYIDGNSVFKKLMQDFGRKKTHNGLDLCYFRFLLVRKPKDSSSDWIKVLYLPKNGTKLEESQILSLEEIEMVH